MKYEFETCVLNTLTREVQTNGQPVTVEPKAFDFIAFLLENRERVVTRDELIDALWEGRFISDASLSTALKSARRAVGDDGDAQRIIKTVRGHGFRFVAELKETQTAPMALPPAVLRGAEEDQPSIAVMPFELMSAAPDQDYFADGICEDVIASLGRIKWLRVISRNSTFSYRGQTLDVRAASSELGARYILTGSVRKAAEQVRVSVQLLNGESGAQIWSARHDRRLEDVFAVQDEITERIVAALEPEVSQEESRAAMRKPVQNLTAWDYVMRALARKSENTDAGSRDAIALLEKAIEIDPEYARALGLLAALIIWRVHQGWEDPHSAVLRAQDLAQRAVRSDPDEIWAFVAFGFVATIISDPDMIMDACRRVLEINPSFAVGHSYTGAALAVTGRGSAAFAYLEKARKLSPRDIQKEEFDVHESFAHFQIGDYDAAYRAAHRATLPQPDHVYPRFIMASSLAHLGYDEEARVQVAKIQSIAPGITLEVIRSSCVFMVEDDIERFVGGLAKAGIT